MLGKIWFTICVVTLSSLGVFVPSTVFAQHRPGMHGPGSGPDYDTTSEATFTGTVEDVRTGRSALYWLSQIHTMGLGHKRVQEKQLLLKTETDTIQIHLGPTAFLTEKQVEIRKGDILEVTGSRVTIGESQLVLARGRATSRGRFARPQVSRSGIPFRPNHAGSGRRKKSCSQSLSLRWWLSPPYSGIEMRHIHG